MIPTDEPLLALRLTEETARLLLAYAEDDRASVVTIFNGLSEGQTADVFHNLMAGTIIGLIAAGPAEPDLDTSLERVAASLRHLLGRT